MNNDASTLFRRHALKMSLVYLLIRGVPELLTWLWVVMPASLRQQIYDGSGELMWLLFAQPPRPLELIDAVPMRFQMIFNSFGPLFFEVLLVFLFSLWMLRKRGAVPARESLRKAWGVFIGATLLWSFGLRYLLLGAYTERQFDSLGFGETTFDNLHHQIFDLYWSGIPLFYLSVLLWAWVPVWLHFKVMARAAETPDRADMGPRWKRAVVTAAFVLAFMMLHYGVVQAVGMAFWPWVSAKQDVFLPTEELENIALPLLLGQLIMPTIAAFVAARLYGRTGHLRKESVGRLLGVPMLAGALAWLLPNLIFLALAWLGAYFLYDFGVKVLMATAYEPVVGYALFALLNLFSLLLVCGVAVFLRGPLPGGAETSGQALPAPQA